MTAEVIRWNCGKICSQDGQLWEKRTHTPSSDARCLCTLGYSSSDGWGKVLVIESFSIPLPNYPGAEKTVQKEAFELGFF